MKWHFIQQDEQQGPVTEEQIKGLLAAGNLNADNLAWCEGMAEWKPIGEIAELSVRSLNEVASKGISKSPNVSARENCIPTYLWQSIVVTICCCLPFGVVAIVYASKVAALEQSGDIAGAAAASESAKKWCHVSFLIGVLFTVITFVLGALT